MNRKSPLPPNRHPRESGDPVPIDLRPHLNTISRGTQQCAPVRNPPRINPSRISQGGPHQRPPELLKVRLGHLPHLQAPAGEGAVRSHSASVPEPGADAGELPLRRRRLAVVIKAPAGQCTIGHHAAGMPRPGADCGELTLWRCCLPEPIPASADHGAVRFHSAGVEFPGADARKLPFRRRGCAVISTAPADQGAVRPNSAGVLLHGDYASKRPLRRYRLADHVTIIILIRTPAGHCTVGHHAAGMPRPGADAGEVPYPPGQSRLVRFIIKSIPLADNSYF